MRVEAYRNLHKDCYSVRCNGRVIKHDRNLILTNATFAVQPAGNAKVRATGRKNVHAFIRGEYVEWEPEKRYRMLTPIRVRYNPYEHTTFVNESGEAVLHADVVFLSKLGAFISES